MEMQLAEEKKVADEIRRTNEELKRKAGDQSVETTPLDSDVRRREQSAGLGAEVSSKDSKTETEKALEERARQQSSETVGVTSERHRVNRGVSDSDT